MSVTIKTASPQAARRAALLGESRGILEEGSPAASKYLAAASAGTVKADRARTEAARTLLDRVGLVPPERAKDDAGKDVQEMNAGELHALLHNLEGELASRAKPIIVADATDEPDQPTDMFG